jgi:D-amino-acid dehydrogenase
MQNIVIIGGGIIGLSCAYYLHKTGHKVTVLEKGSLDDNCSFGNAGMIVPSHFVPLSAPGMIEQGMRWMFDSKSPFYVRPSFNLDLFKWGLKFMKNATEAHLKHSAVPLRDLSLLSKSLYQELANQQDFDFGLENNGILMLYKTEKTGEEEMHLAEKAKALGLDVAILSVKEAQLLQPDLQLNVAGAVHYRCDAHLSPQVLMKQLTAYLEKVGVVIKRNSEVVKIDHHRSRISKVHTPQSVYEADQVVIAGGAWSAAVAKLAGLKISLMPGKGYSFMIDEPAKRMHIAALLMEARVSVTPMTNQVRFGGTMELGPLNNKINMNRVKGIVESIPQYLPDFNPEISEISKIWYGFRPCSPDGLPYIGRADKYQNLLIAGGHGMMGLSLGPATGKLISELIAEQPVSVNIEAFSPAR